MPPFAPPRHAAFERRSGHHDGMWVGRLDWLRTPRAGVGSIPMARIRARCVAAWVFAQGKSGPVGKYWTSSCIYRPEGNVMPAYSTWQPTEGRIPPRASADHSATRRLVDPRGDSLRGNPIVSTVLGIFGGPSNPCIEGAITHVGESVSGHATPS